MPEILRDNTPIAPMRGMKRAVKAELRLEFKGIGLEWALNQLPRHFTRAAYSRYGKTYKRRQKEYEVHKAARKGGSNAPLVYNGKLRDGILSSVKLRNTSEHVITKMTVPPIKRGLGRGKDKWRLSYRGALKDHGVDLFGEILATSEGELAAISRRLETAVKRAFETKSR